MGRKWPVFISLFLGRPHPESKLEEKEKDGMIDSTLDHRSKKKTKYMTSGARKMSPDMPFVTVRLFLLFCL